MNEQREQQLMFREIITQYATLKQIEQSIALVCGMDLLKEEGLVKIGEIISQKGELERAHPWLKEI